MFKASKIWALVGLPLVVVAVVIVALDADPTDPNPKGTLAVIFAILAAFFVVLFILQARDLKAATLGAVVPESAIGRPIDNPMTMTEPELWAALAIHPIDAEALAARAEGWEAARSSLGAGRVVTALIFVFVPLTYLLETFVPVLVGATLIVAYVGYRARMLFGASGQLERGYDAADRAMAPLGLRISAKPQVSTEPRFGPAPGRKPRISGPLGFGGSRHGRNVRVEMGMGRIRVDVAVPSPEFSAGSSDGRIKGKGRESLPPQLEAALNSVPASRGWKNLVVSGDADGVHVERSRSTESRDWLCDLWLAEKLAAAVS